MQEGPRCNESFEDTDQVTRERESRADEVRNNDNKLMARYHVFGERYSSNRGCTTRSRLTLNATPPRELCGPPRRQVAPPPHVCDCLRRVKTVRFMKGCRIHFRRSLNRPLTERRRLETSPVALPDRPAVTAEAQCSTQPFSLIRDRPKTLERT